VHIYSFVALLTSSSAQASRTTASIKACLFHVGQAWFKNWLGLVYNLLMAMIFDGKISSIDQIC